MRPPEMRKILRGCGFVLHRQGSKHEVWRHANGMTISLPHGSKLNPFATRATLSSLRRAGLL